MKKFNAKSLEDALLLASKELNCLVTDLEYEILQSPSKGFLGLFSKEAIIVVNVKQNAQNVQDSKNEDLGQNFESKKQIQDTNTQSQNLKQETAQDAALGFENAKKQYANKEKSDSDNLGNDAFDKYQDGIQKPKTSDFNDYSDRVWGNKPKRDNDALAVEIKQQLDELFSLLPFDLDTINVEIDKNILKINIDGRDCALLIGEKGYRYKALSYLLFNWIGPKYGLIMRLEVAEFLQNQEQMMDIYLENVIRSIDENGSGQTKPLDGILAYIGLRKLREAFPYKNVSFGVGEDGIKYVIVSDNTRKSLDSGI